VSEKLRIADADYFSAFSPTVCTSIHMRIAMQHVARVPDKALFALTMGVISKSKPRIHLTQHNLAHSEAGMGFEQRFAGSGVSHFAPHTCLLLESCPDVVSRLKHETHRRLAVGSTRLNNLKPVD
jgi:hypothetical protein